MSSKNHKICFSSAEEKTTIVVENWKEFNKIDDFEK